MLEAYLNSIIQSYGPIGLLVTMIIQTIVAPIPSEALLIFSGTIGIAIFDIVIFGGIGSIIGAIIAFYIGRIGREPIVAKLVGKKWLGRVDGWVERNGVTAIFVARLIPIIPFDLISYVAGITSLSFRYYFIATVLGAFPRCLLLALFGTSFGTALKLMGFTLELTFLLCIIGIVAFVFLERIGFIDKVEEIIMKFLLKRKLRKS
jgi:uncharacterized membrane protein YdjX (TVP38/TMEM64 family)